MHRVFVYGTLKRDFPNHGAWMKEYPCLGRFRTCVAFPLVVGGKWFSPCLIAEPGVGVPVFGEVFELDDRGLDVLDAIEGTDVPNGYRRIGIAVEDAGCDYADTLRVRDAEGDRAKAISLLDESLAISSELGMRPLMERVLSRREILKA